MVDPPGTSLKNNYQYVYNGQLEEETNDLVAECDGETEDGSEIGDDIQREGRDTASGVAEALSTAEDKEEFQGGAAAVASRGEIFSDVSPHAPLLTPAAHLFPPARASFKADPSLPDLPSYKDQTRSWRGSRSPNVFVVPPRNVVPVTDDGQAPPPSPPPAKTEPLAPSTELSPSKTLSTLMKDGFPFGLADQMVRIQEMYPFRWWVVDNSGSMMTADCHRLVEGQSNRFASPQCARWDELKDTVKYHAQLAGTLKATTTFRLLNNPGARVGPQEFTINGESDVETANAIMDKVEPDGVTPLTQHIVEITRRISKLEHGLITSGKKAVVVIATDGLPTDEFGDSGPAVQHEFAMALKALEAKPVWLIARLCTNDKAVVKFWSQLDCKLELPLESIDDYIHEAMEIQSKNKWLNYGMPLHRSREFGLHHKVFDLLDERRLTKDELLKFFKHMFGKDNFRNAPDIHTNWKGFAKFLANLVIGEQLHWCPVSRKMDHWIDVPKLTQVYGDGLLLSMRNLRVYT